MKSIKLIWISLLLAVTLSTQGQEQQPKKEYEKGDQFVGKQGEKITLVNTKKFPQGIIAWKTKWELNGKTSTVYVPVEYLKECSIIINDKNKKNE